MKMVISGIYKITCKSNGRFYIGSSCNINKRLSDHKNKLRKNKHHNPKLQNSFNKYKEVDFLFEIIETCSKEELLKREQYYINVLKPKFNISLTSFAPMTGRKHNSTTLKNFKNRPVPRGENHYKFGKSWTPGQRKKILQSRIGVKRSESFKNKQRENAIRLNLEVNLHKYIEKCKRKVKDSLGNIFNSLVDTAKYHKMSVSAVCDILKGRTKKTKKGIIFYYV